MGHEENNPITYNQAGWLESIKGNAFKPFDPGGGYLRTVEYEPFAWGNYGEAGGVIGPACGVMVQEETSSVEEPEAGELVFGPVAPHYIDPG